MAPMAWNTGGMALDQTLRRVRESGLGVVDVEWGMNVLNQAITTKMPPVVLASPMDWDIYINQLETLPHWLSKFKSHQEQTPYVESAISQMIESMPMGEKVTFIKQQIQEILITILGETVDEEEALMEAGLDSLSSVEFRNALQKTFDLTLSSTLMFDYPNVKALTEFIAAKFVSEDPFTTDPEYHFTYDRASPLDKCRDFTVFRKDVGWVKFLGVLDIRSFDVNKEVVISPKKVTTGDTVKGTSAVLFLERFVPTDRLTKDIYKVMSSILAKRGNHLLNLDEINGDTEWFTPNV